MTVYLTAEAISKSYSEKTLLENGSLTVNEGDRIGLIGVNGTGKSTLLKILAGLETPDSGSVTRMTGLRTAYLPQNPEFTQGLSVLRQTMLHAASGDSAEYECRALLTRLGLRDLDQDVSQLSGGQKKRAALAAALAGHARLLILDEPTNHIDMDTVLWLEDFLAKFNGAVVMITHDRYFLERISNRIVELQNSSLYQYPANYSKYLELKAQREEMQAASERKRQALLKKELAWIQRGARARGTKAQFRINRFEELSSQPVQEQEETLTLSALSSRLGKKVIEAEAIGKSYDGRSLFHDFSYLLARRDRLGVIGPNGCGKSTLLRVLAGRLAPDEGKVVCGETVRIGFFSQEGQELNPSQRVIDFIRDTAERIETPEGTVSASQMLERFLFPAALQYTTIGRLSGGERRRLQLLNVLMQAPNVLFLDEPTNDLDVETLAILEDYLDAFPGAVIAVSHDRYFMDRVAAHTFAFEEDGTLRQYLGGYSDYLAARPDPTADRAETPRPKQERRRTAQKLKFTFREQREFETIDDEVAELEEKCAALLREMEQAASDYGRLQELSREKEEADRALEEKTERWIYLHDLEEKIRAQEEG